MLRLTRRLTGTYVKSLEAPLPLKKRNVKYIVKVKSNKETKKTKCNFYNRSFCKAGQNCLFYHPNKDCESHMFGNVCRNRECEKGHKLIFKYWERNLFQRK